MIFMHLKYSIVHAVYFFISNLEYFLVVLGTDFDNFLYIYSPIYLWEEKLHVCRPFPLCISPFPIHDNVQLLHEVISALKKRLSKTIFKNSLLHQTDSCYVSFQYSWHHYTIPLCVSIPLLKPWMVIQYYIVILEFSYL